MRDDQVTPCGTFEQRLNAAPGAQVQFPAAFPGPAEGRVRREELRTVQRARLLVRQTGQAAVVHFLPVGIEFERDIQPFCDDLGRLARPRQRTGDAQVERDPLGLPAFRQGLGLGAPFLGQREVGLSLKTVLGVAHRFAVPQEGDVIILITHPFSL